MKSLGLFILLLALSLLLAAVAAPWIHPLFPDRRIEYLITPIAKLTALPLTLLLMARLGLGSRNALGFGLPGRHFIREAAKGWLLGLAIILPVAGALLLTGARVVAAPPGEWLRLAGYAAISGLLSGLVIALVEESFFRGALYSALRQESGWLWAALGSSLYYAALHFVDPPGLPAGTVIDWSSGLQILAGSFERFTDPRTVDSLLALTLVGLLLAVVREQRGTIALCIGIHAAWVFVIRVLRKLSEVDKEATASALVGNYDGVVGWLTFGYLALLIGLILSKRTPSFFTPNQALAKA